MGKNTMTYMMSTVMTAVVVVPMEHNWTMMKNVMVVAIPVMVGCGITRSCDKYE